MMDRPDFEEILERKRIIEYEFSLITDEDMIDSGMAEAADFWGEAHEYLDTHILKELILKECFLHQRKLYITQRDQIYEVVCLQ
jgi:hypothetical protein